MKQINHAQLLKQDLIDVMVTERGPATCLAPEDDEPHRELLVCGQRLKEAAYIIVRSEKQDDVVCYLWFYQGPGQNAG